MHAESWFQHEVQITCAEEWAGREAGGAKPSKTETAAETSFSDIEVSCSNTMRPWSLVNRV
jgi:hypothetical protein